MRNDWPDGAQVAVSLTFDVDADTLIERMSESATTWFATHGDVAAFVRR